MARAPQSAHVDPTPAPAGHTEPKGKRTVTVACKFQAGLLLRLCAPRTVAEPLMGGGSREVKQYFPVGEPVYVHGPAEPAGQAPEGYVRPQLQDGYALTHGIDADFFAEWLKQNKDTDLVRSRVIFAASGADAVQGQAKDNRDVRSGFEPINPKGDPRTPKPIAGVGAIMPADRTAA